MDITIKTLNKQGENDRNVTLFLHKDNTVSLLGNLEHNTTVVVDQDLVDSLQRMVYAIKYQKINQA